MESLNLPWARKSELPWVKSEGTYCVAINTALYSPEAILKTCYLFLDQCYLFIDTESENLPEIKVYFSPSEETGELRKIVGEFSNRLIWQETRQKVAFETQHIREAIVAQAFAEGNIFNSSKTEADYNDDPLGIAN